MFTRFHNLLTNSLPEERAREKIADLELKIAILEAKLEVEVIRSEEVALLNEQLRRWVMLGTAATQGMLNSLNAQEVDRKHKYG